MFLPSLSKQVWERAEVRRHGSTGSFIAVGPGRRSSHKGLRPLLLLPCLPPWPPCLSRGSSTFLGMKGLQATNPAEETAVPVLGRHKCLLSAKTKASLQTGMEVKPFQLLHHLFQTQREVAKEGLSCFSTTSACEDALIYARQESFSL